MRQFDGFGVTLALVVAVVAQEGCASREEYDSESHFACSSDSACRRLGAGYSCVARRCTLKLDGAVGSPEAGRHSVEGGAEAGIGSGGSAPDSGSNGGTGGKGGTGGSGGASSAPDAGRSGGGGGSAEGDAGDADAGVRTPAPIVGVISENGALSYVRVDPTTGEESHRVSLSNLDSIAIGITGWDSALGRFYALVNSNDQVHRLLALDGATGAVVSSPPVSLNLASIEVDGAGNLFGMFYTGVVDSFVSSNVAPATGMVQTLAELSLTGGAGPAQGMSAIDEANGRYYHTRYENDGTPRLLTLDTVTGQVVFDTVTDFELYNPEVDADGAVVAFVLIPGQDNELRYVDPVNGTTTFIANVGSPGLGGGNSALDRSARVMYQTYSRSGGGGGLLTVDLVTGRVTNVPTVHELGELEVCSTCR